MAKYGGSEKRNIFLRPEDEKKLAAEVKRFQFNIQTNVTNLYHLEQSQKYRRQGDPFPTMPRRDPADLADDTIANKNAAGKQHCGVVGMTSWSGKSGADSSAEKKQQRCIGFGSSQSGWSTDTSGSVLGKSSSSSEWCKSSSASGSGWGKNSSSSGSGWGKSSSGSSSGWGKSSSGSGWSKSSSGSGSGWGNSGSSSGWGNSSSGSSWGKSGWND